MRGTHRPLGVRPRIAERDKTPDGVLGVPAAELDTTTAMARHPISALFIAGDEDTIMLVDDIARLRALAKPDSELVVVPQATHEGVPYFFHELDKLVAEWLETKAVPKLQPVGQNTH